MRKFKVTFWLGLAVAVATLPGCVRLSVGTSQPPPPPVVNVTPTWPIPSNAPPPPPAIPTLPAASATTPPADRIADPVPSAAVTAPPTCGEWHHQSKYGDRWQTSSTWWEYECTATTSQYHNICPGPMCNAFCPECWTEVHVRVDYFYWDGTNSVFYGQRYSEAMWFDGGFDPGGEWSYWWDGPTMQWYYLGQTA